ncbi:MAG: ABC transporter permease [Pseudomonadota bacterium]
MSAKLPTRETPDYDEHYVAPDADKADFAELPDAPPRQRFRLSWTGKIGVAVVLFWLFIAFFGSWLAPYGENDLPFPDDYAEFQEPRAGAWLGTDGADRDVLSRLLYGAGRTLGISVTAAVLAYIIGVTAGMLAAAGGRWLDAILSRTNDAFLSFPNIMLGLIVVAAVGSSIPVLILTAAGIYATIVFRLARAIAMEVAVMDYVEAARVRGENTWWVILREVWPNAALPLLSDFGLRTIYIILFISSLGFLGLGVQPPQADWGSMVRENLGALQYGGSIWAVLAPAFAIASVTVAINLIVDDVSVHSGGRLAQRL